VPLLPLKCASLAAAAAAVLLLGSCGGGGGGDPGQPEETTGVFTGFTDRAGALDWESTGGDGSGVGAGADGDGGVGAGGDFGQFRNATITVYLEDGRLLGSAKTDTTKGMVTVKPGRNYSGILRLELRGGPDATYYEEGRNTFVPFPADRVIRVWVPAIRSNIGITPFTEAAYRLLTEGSTPERVSGTPTRTQIRAANDRVRGVLNQQFPSLLHVSDITRLPFIKSPSVTAGTIGTDERGKYGIVNGAFSKQASVFNSDSTAPTLDATRQLAEDLLDGQLDGRNGAASAAPAAQRTYDPNTLAGELSSALAEQAFRFGSTQVQDVLPPVLNFGNVRYEGYLFDGSISKQGEAHSTVSGWVGANTKNFTPGQEFDRLPGRRAMVLYANNGHGGGFYKADANGPRHTIYAIGDNVAGELGLGTVGSTNAQAVELTLPGALTHAAGGFAHTVARFADGSVWTWGDNSYGQLGQGSVGAGSTTPLRVTLPAAAVAVAATNVASYALLEDGRVFAWGSNGGFGLLGNGSADGALPTPAAVAGLADIVQITARDNDVAVLRRDNTVWHWGSFPADPNTLVPGNPAAPALGGNRTPVQAAGLPAGVQVRKILTEQGLFAALLANGHVYTWGVYHDITAGTVLRDLSAVRVLGLPPLRDMMPGGFVGYGVRAFDRLTAMGVDYRGGMWKIRGRVAEVFDPENPAAQRRPQNQGPRDDCSSCHAPLDQSLVEILAASPQPTSGSACLPPANVHNGLSASLIHAETDCVQCHNPSRLSYPPTNPSGSHPFAASGGWPNCAKPAGRPSRITINPPAITNSCEVPPNHVFTPPGTVCASCHNSVIARPLRDLSPSCAQPRASELPTIATTATIVGAFNDGGGAIAGGSLTNDRTPELRGTLSAALTGTQTLSILRDGTAVGSATVTGTNWTYTDTAPDGARRYTARVIAGAAFGATSNALAFTVDATAPAFTPTITGFTDDTLGAIAVGAFMTDTTPTVGGNLNGTLASGEVVQVLRNGVVVGTATAGTTTWSYVEPAALALGTYTYQARVVDAAGNIGTASATAQLTLVGSLAAATITQATNDAGVVIASGGATTDTTPTLAGTLSAALPSGHVLRVLRNGTAVGPATVSGTGWTFTPAAAADGSYSFTARVEAGAVTGTGSSAYTLTIDTVAPTQTANATLISDDFNGALANAATTADTTPIVSGTLSAALATGEQVRVLRNGAAVATVAAAGTTWTYTEPTPLASATYTYSAQVVDAAGQLGPAGSTRSVTVNAAGVPLLNAATTITTINGVTPTSNAVPVNNDSTPTVAGTIQRALNTGEVVRVYRNGASIGNATVTGTNWTWPSTSLGDGTYTFRALIEVAANPTVFGLTSATVSVPIDTAAPTQTATLSQIYDDSGALVTVTGSYSTDTTPRLDGTLSAALASGDYIRILRNSVVVATIRPTGTTWSYVEPNALALGTYNYTVDIRDDAGNVGTVAAGPTKSVTLISSSSLPTATITTALVSGAGSPGKPDGTIVASGGGMPDTSPTLRVSLSATLPAGYQVVLYRDGTAVLTTSTCTTPCDLTDPGPASQGTRGYTARTIAGGVNGTLSSTYSLVIDTTAPAQTVSITQVRSDYPAAYSNAVAGAIPADNLILNGGTTFNSGQTHDSTPIYRFSLSAAPGAGESIEIRRGSTVVSPTLTSCGANCYEFPAPTGLSVSTAFDAAGAAALPSPSGTGFQSVGTAAISVRVVDTAGNESGASSFTVNVGYFDCHQNRANTTIGGTHTTISRAAAPTTRCSDCHQRVQPDTAAGTGTAAGAFIAVPSSVPTYWCRRPA
jgi:hypothetical protein